MPLQREHRSVTPSIANGAAVSGEIQIGDAAAGVLFCPAGYASNTALTFTAAPTSGGTFLPLYDKAGAAVGITLAAGQAFALPEEVMMCRYVKYVIGGNATQLEELPTSFKS